MTSPSRNDATNPLKEPTPSTLQGTFLSGGNLTDANNGSASTTAAATIPSTTAAIAETVWSVRTAAAATQPVKDGRRRPGRFSDASAVIRPDPVADVGVGDESVMTNMLKDWFGDRKDERGDAAAKPSGAAAAAASAGPFERWDEASEEQERALEDAMRGDRPDYDSGLPPSSDPSPPPSSSVLAADQNTPSRWFVLLLSGNSTVAQMRRTDFAKYLKLNLAARLSLEYDEVKINRVLVVPPRLMVNVSVVPVSERASAAVTATVTAYAAATDTDTAADATAATAADVAAATAASVVVTTAAAATATQATTSASRSPSSWPLSRSSAAARIEDDDPLHNLVETNATLMELSGEEYRVGIFIYSVGCA